MKFNHRITTSIQEEMDRVFGPENPPPAFTPRLPGPTRPWPHDEDCLCDQCRPFAGRNEDGTLRFPRRAD